MYWRDESVEVLFDGGLDGRFAGLCEGCKGCKGGGEGGGVSREGGDKGGEQPSSGDGVGVMPGGKGAS